MSAHEASSYDEVPYESHPFPQTHPDRLATVATLLGMTPKPVAKCRVLELGCAAGGNLIPMAATLPDSEFVGVDLSGRQIDDGQRIVQALGLGNVALHHRSILDVGADLGRFDYIVCHGVYSWVPPHVQSKILDVCRESLADDGVAYVSYNTFPGWHMRSMIRRMMLYHASRFPEPKERVRQARALLKFLSTSVAQDTPSPYSLLLKSELELLDKCRDSYLFHEHLETHNDPVYFHEFVERVQGKGLQYLGEADFAVMVPANFKPEVRQVLQKVSPDMLHLEQYMDFLRNRTFRQTLLCHRAIKPNYKVDASLLAGMLIASRGVPAAGAPAVDGKEAMQFKGPGSATLTSKDPLVKAAMLALAEAWPRALTLAELTAQAHERLERRGQPEARDAQHLAANLLNVFSAGTPIVELHLHRPSLPKKLGERPTASPLARLQAERGLEVTNLIHERATLDEFGRQVLRHLDGKRDRDALLEVVEQLVDKGVLAVQQEGKAVKDPKSVRTQIKALLDKQLRLLHRNALLTA